MKDRRDRQTPDLYVSEPTNDLESAKKRGRPKTGHAKSDAQRSKEYRQRKAKRAATIKDPTLPLSSDIIWLGEVRGGPQRA